MAKIEDLQNELDQMRKLLVSAGLVPGARKSERNTDYVEHGSMQHATMLGLVEVENADAARKDGHTVYVSAKTNKLWRLDDEVAALRHYPGVQPDQALKVVLRQKVGALESGAPHAPVGAPAMFEGY